MIEVMSMTMIMTTIVIFKLRITKMKTTKNPFSRETQEESMIVPTMEFGELSFGKHKIYFLCNLLLISIYHSRNKFVFSFLICPTSRLDGRGTSGNEEVIIRSRFTNILFNDSD